MDQSLFSKKSLSRFRKIFQSLLVMVLICGLIWTGGLIWIDNRIAIIPDEDPGTMAEVGHLLNLTAGDPPDNLHSDNNGSDSQAGSPFILGNGDRDDNRERYFELPAANSQNINLEAKTYFSNFSERRTVRAYKDFGHLKLMPAALNPAGDHFYIRTYLIKDHPQLRRGLFLFVLSCID